MNGMATSHQSGLPVALGPLLGAVAHGANLDAARRSPERPCAFLGSGEQRKTGLIRLAHGDTQTLATSGPFSWEGACSDDGGGDTRLT